MSPKAQPIKPPTTVSTTVTKQNKQNEETPQVSDTTNQASTSKGTTLDKHLEQQDTVLVPATKEEIRITTDALLSLGNDLNFGLEADPIDNDLLQPIAPRSTLPDPTPMVSEINSDDTEILDEHVAPDENNMPIVPTTKGTDVKQEKRKGQLVIQSFQLARNYKPKCKFSCVGCPQKFANNKELNDRFRSSHPLLTCSDCKKLFPTPSAFEKHKYTHYDFMYKCETCNKGFHFESELSAHRRKHIADQGLVCFHTKCGKRFKRSSELNAHLKITRVNQSNVNTVRTQIKTLEMLEHMLAFILMFKILSV